MKTSAPHPARSAGPRSPARAIFFSTALVLMAVAWPGCQSPPREVKSTRVYMGTLVEITALGPDRARLEQAVDKAFAEIGRIEALMSSYREDSDVSRINEQAGAGLVVVDPEVFDVIERSVDVSSRSDGAFDITVAGLKGLWSLDFEHPRVASAAEISARLPLVSWKGVRLDREKHAAGLARKGMRIDLGGIAKGCAVDRAIAVLRSEGVSMAMVNAGGDLFALGGRGGRAWNVGIQDPRDRGLVIGRFPVTDLAVATSGDYEKYIEVGGRRYCHIMDPRTGAPASSCQSVTVAAGEAWLADAYATAVFVLGPQKGMELVRAQEGVEAVIIDAGGKIELSDGLQGRITWERDER